MPSAQLNLDSRFVSCFIKSVFLSCLFYSYGGAEDHKQIPVTSSLCISWVTECRPGTAVLGNGPRLPWRKDNSS